MTAFFVPGIPAPQGSKRYVGNGISIESSKRVKPWRSDIRDEAMKHCDGDNPLGPVHVTLAFTMPRPKSHYRSGKNAHLLRDDAPDYVSKRPDLDKLVRAVLDALKSIAWNDDAQVAHLTAVKRYPMSGSDSTGVYIDIEPEEAT